MRASGRSPAVLALAVLLGACTAPESRWEVGGLYSVWEGEESFGVVKILAIDPQAVSVRWYKESFPTRPEQAASSELTLGTIDDDVAGFGHFPLTYRDFKLMFPLKVGQESVSAEELEGYEMWKEVSGEAVSFDDLAATMEQVDELIDAVDEEALEGSAEPPRSEPAGTGQGETVDD